MVKETKKISSFIIDKYISIYCFLLAQIAKYYLLIILVWMILKSLYYISDEDLGYAYSSKEIIDFLVGIILFTILYRSILLFKKHNKEVTIDYSEDVLICGTSKFNRDEVFSVFEFRFLSAPFAIIKTTNGNICFCPKGARFRFVPFWFYQKPQNLSLQNLNNWIKDI